MTQFSEPFYRICRKLSREKVVKAEVKFMVSGNGEVVADVVLIARVDVVRVENHGGHVFRVAGRERGRCCVCRFSRAYAAKR